MNKNILSDKKYLRIIFVVLLFAVAGTLLLTLTNAGPSDPNDPNYPLADTNSDYKVNVYDLSYILIKWGTNDSKADFNNDRSVNVFDISYLLAQWGRVDDENNPATPNNSPERPCTVTVSDFGSMVNATSSAGPGTVVCVNNTITGSAYIGGVNGLPGNPVVLRGIDPNNRTKWNVSGDSGLQFVNSSYVEVRNFEMIGNSSSTRYGFIIGQQAGSWNNNVPQPVHHMTYYNNKIHGFSMSGIQSTALATNHTIIDSNVIYNNAKSGNEGGSGISLVRPANGLGGAPTGGYSNRIYNNLLYENEQRVASTGIGYDAPTDGNCIILDQFNVVGYNERTLIANNICFDNGRGIHIFQSAHVDVVNNTLYQNSTNPLGNQWGLGELNCAESNDCQFSKNLVWPRQGVQVLGTYSAGDYSYNDNLFLNTDVPSAASSSGTGNQSTTEDPFENASIDPTAAFFNINPGTQAASMGVGADADKIPRF